MAEAATLPSGRTACWSASWRFFGLAPIATSSIIATIAANAVYHGWLLPVKRNSRFQIELVAFALELLLLVWSYLAAILRGPGFVPSGWAPTDVEFEKQLGCIEERPLAVKPPLTDFLQSCKRCNGFKPPRAHHCSSCNRCVLGMDHHCPWINTCVGHDNLQAFVLFIHYAPLACLHSCIIHVDVPIYMCLLVYRKRYTQFWMYASDVHVVLALVCWLASLLIMLLVGNLAWEMHWSINMNMTMVEDRIVSKAEARRFAQGENRFVFPYDHGTKKNWEEIMGHYWSSWLLPVVATRSRGSSGFWPLVRSGSGSFDLSTEQLAQKAHKLGNFVVMPVVRDFRGERWYLWHFCVSLCRCEWCTACFCNGCCEPRLTLRKGDRVFVNYQGQGWLFGHVFESGAMGPGGWFSARCVKEAGATHYEVPHQRLLQGIWESSTGRTVKVSGLVACVSPTGTPFVFREEAESTVLTGCRLEACDGTFAKWSNGDTWVRRVSPSPSDRAISRRAAGSDGVIATVPEVKKDI